MAVLLLESPFKFDDYVRPACLPPIDWTSKFSEGIMVASGMGDIGINITTTELNLDSIQMFSKDKCKSLDYPGRYGTFKGKPPISF